MLLISARQKRFVSHSCSGAYEGGKVTSTGHSADQYWLQREAVLVDISYQYWFAYPSPRLVVTAFRYSYIYDRRRVRHHPTAGR